MSKEYCIIQSGSPTDLSKVVQENLDQGWEPHGNLLCWTEVSSDHQRPTYTQWFLQPIIRDKPTDSSRSVRECQAPYTDQLIKELQLSRPGVPGARTELSDDLAEKLLTFLTYAKRAIEQGDWK